MLLPLLASADTVNAEFNSAGDVPFSSNGYSGTGRSLQVTLNFAPATGTNLTVINNTGLGFIDGYFDNVDQGQDLTLTYGGNSYHFIANYFGGTGNDLVLQWRDVRLFAWGLNSSGQLGMVQDVIRKRLQPTPVPTLNLNGATILGASAGTRHTLVLLSDGRIAAWGANESGQLGNGTTTDTVTSGGPAFVNTSAFGGKRPIAIAAGGAHGLALLEDGTVWAWGADDSGQLGNNSTTNRSVPVPVNVSGALLGEEVVAIAAGEKHSLALCFDGTVVAWGNNQFGQLGNGTTSNRLAPVRVALGTVPGLVSSSASADGIAAGANHSLAHDIRGYLIGWGSNDSGQLRWPTTSYSESAIIVAGVETVAIAYDIVDEFAAGRTHTLVNFRSIRTFDGVRFFVTGFGGNQAGQIPRSDGKDYYGGFPTRYWLPPKILAAGDDFTIGFYPDGVKLAYVNNNGVETTVLSEGPTIYGWGNNTNGELGTNSPTYYGTPQGIASTGELGTGERFINLAAGPTAHHCLGIVAKPPALPATVNVTLARTFFNLEPPPIASDGYLAAGRTINFNLPFPASADLKVINNLGSGPIEGTFSNLNQGEITLLTYAGNGKTYQFKAKYNGGDGNDLVLEYVGTPPPITVSPQSQTAGSFQWAPNPMDHAVHIGGTGVGVGLSQTFTIKNDSTAAFSISNVTIDGLNPNDFQVTSMPASSVAAGGTTSFTVTFTPGAALSRSGTVHILSGDQEFSTFDFVVNGNGTSALNAVFNSASDVPVTANGFTATSSTVNFTLNYAPAPGTTLTVVKNTDIDFINGQFSNLAQGQPVAVTYSGTTYNFVANYYGGSGNDLVLQWASTRLLGWGRGDLGELGIDAQEAAAPTSVPSRGALAGKTILSVAEGEHHSLALCSDGTIAAWGHNPYGELGNPVGDITFTPVQVNQTGALAGKTVVAVAAGSNFSLALCSDGTIASWGYNIGPGGGTIPVQVNAGAGSALNGRKVVAISAGAYFALALCSDGTVAGWGDGSFGQLGIGAAGGSSIPMAVSFSSSLSLKGKRMVAISAGLYHSLALTSDGIIAAWGLGDSGQLGTRRMLYKPPTFATLPLPANNLSGVVGLGNSIAGKTVVGISAGGYHSLAVCSDGTAAAWGTGGLGVLGTGDYSQRDVPAAVDVSGVLAGRTVVSVRAGYYHSLALCSDGTVAAWGDNYSAQLGIGNPSIPSSARPLAVSRGSLGAAEGVMAAATHGVANRNFIIAGATSPAISVEQPTGTTLANGTTIDFGSSTVGSTVKKRFRIRNRGNGPMTISAINFGSNDFAFTFLFPIRPPRLPLTLQAGGVLDFYAGFTPLGGGARNATMVVSSNDPGTPFTVNLTGMGVDGSLTLNLGQDAPLTISDGQSLGGTISLSLATAPSPGAQYTVVKNTGSGFINGTLEGLAQGQRVTIRTGIAASPPPGLQFAEPAGSGEAVQGYDFVVNYYGGASGRDLVLQWADTRLESWGYNDYGQLGDNSVVSRSKPVLVDATGVLADKTVIAQASGFFHTLALCSDGTIAAWGNNGFGELGSGGNTSSLKPVAVDQTGVLAGKTIIAVAAGNSHSLALSSEGKVYAWGGKPEWGARRWDFDES